MSMKRGTKIALAILAGVVGLGVISCMLVAVMIATAGRVVARVGGSNPTRVAAVAERIAEFELPEGYVADYAAEAAGFSIAAFKPTDGRGHIIVAQTPSWVAVDRAEVEARLQSAAGDKDGVTRLRVEEVREVMLRGAPVTVTVSRGEGSAGQDFYQLLGVFEGKGGTAWLMLVDEVESWDQVEIDAFIGSIE